MIFSSGPAYQACSILYLYFYLDENGVQTNSKSGHDIGVGEFFRAVINRLKFEFYPISGVQQHYSLIDY